MHVMHTLIDLAQGFDLQRDVHLLRGELAHSPGPDRAYLLLDAPQQETVGLWLTGQPHAAALLAQVLALRTGPALLGSRPWALSWIRDGRVHVQRHRLSVDQGAFLLAELAGCEALDRRAHLFERPHEGPLWPAPPGACGAS